MGHGSQLMPVTFFGGHKLEHAQEALQMCLEPLNLGNIKVGQTFLLSKNGSWVLVDACHFFGGVIN